MYLIRLRSNIILNRPITINRVVNRYFTTHNNDNNNSNNNTSIISRSIDTDDLHIIPTTSSSSSKSVYNNNTTIRNNKRSTTKSIKSTKSASAATVSVSSTDLSPMMRQWHQLKSTHSDYLLLFRLGDFYEMFAADAVVASSVLNLTLTKRQSIPMAGFPHYNIDTHIKKLIAANISVAICEQQPQQQQQQKQADTANNSNKSKLLSRTIVRIITPGTIMEENLLSPKSANYLTSITIINNSNNDSNNNNSNQYQCAISSVDISTGILLIQELIDLNQLLTELTRIEPAEILINQQDYQLLISLQQQQSKSATSSNNNNNNNNNNLLKRSIQHILSNFVFTQRSTTQFSIEAYKSIINQFNQLPNELLINNTDNSSYSLLQLSSIYSILDYLLFTQKANLPLLTIQSNNSNTNNNNNTNSNTNISSACMQIDASTRKSLELTHTLSEHKYIGSFLHCIDNTITAAGGRLLSQYISAPLIQPELINNRLNMVEYFYQNSIIIIQLQKLLALTTDIQRALQRLVINKGNARDMKAIAETIKIAVSIKQYIIEQSNINNNNNNNSNNSSNIPIELQSYINNLSLTELSELELLINKTIINDPPSIIDNGNIIEPSSNSELFELIELRDNANIAIKSYENQLKSSTGINNLKIKYNNIIGYYIEINSNSQTELLSHNNNNSKNSFLLIQQLSNNLIRYKSTELIQLQSNIQSAGDRIKLLEFQLFQSLRIKLISSSTALNLLAQSIAIIDLHSSVAQLAINRNYVRPIILDSSNEGEIFEITAGRHPVVEARLGLGTNRIKSESATVTATTATVSASAPLVHNFTPNDCRLNSLTERLCLLTGPNMAGKSTFLRQQALIVIMAQSGLYVPASAAKLTIIDRIYSRVGASDDLSRDTSTFLLEMLELANILNTATPRSLVIVDEIGRGTAAIDGLVISMASLEYLYSINQSRTLFATHYHELSAVRESLEAVKCYKMAVESLNNTGDLIFLHSVIPGVVDSSSGINVARMAGIPSIVSNRATELLVQLESNQQQIEYKAAIKKVLTRSNNNNTNTTIIK